MEGRGFSTTVVGEITLAVGLSVAALTACELLVVISAIFS